MTYILRLGKIQTKIETLQSEVDTLQGGSGGGSGSGVNAEVQAAINNLQTDLDSLESQYLNLLTQYSNLNNSVTNVNNELDTLETSHVNLSSQYTTLNTKTTNTQNDLDILESSHTTLQTNYTTVNNKANSIQSDLDTLESSHTTLQSAYTTLNNKVTTIDGEVDTLQSGFTALDTQLDNLEIEVDNLIASVNSSGVNWSDITPATIPTTFNPVNHNTKHIPGGTDIIPDATITISGLMSNVDKTKLNGIATQATLNSTDAFLLNRTNHTGSQAISTISTLQTTLDAKEPTITNLPVTKGGTGNTSIAIDNIFYASAANTLTATPITSYVRTLLDDIDATTFRTTLGLGSIATQNSNSISITGGTISIPTLNTNAIERNTSGILNLGVTANNTTVEIGSLSTVINVGTGAVGKTINIGGHSSDILNITGSVVSQNVTNTNITDKLITLNKGGAASSADGSGFELEENASITSYFKIGNTRNSFDLKTPARSGIFQFTPSTSAFTHQILSPTLTANRILTLPDSDLTLGTMASQNDSAVNITGGNATLTQATITTTRTAAIQRSVAGTMLVGTTNTTTQLDLGNESTSINIGTGTAATTFTIGSSNDTIDFRPQITTLNKAGAASTATNAGFQIEENASITGYFKVANTRNSFELKTPARSGILRFTPSSSAFTHEIITANTANRTYTLPDADINLNSQAQNLIYASPSSGTGAMSIRSLVGNDIPLATNTLRGAITREASGTFTPVLEGGTTAGSNTYASRIGTYYVVGKICVATIYIQLSTKDTQMAGNVMITGLPFTTASGIQSAAVSQYAGITFTAGYTQLGARIESSNTRILLFEGGSGQTTGFVIQSSAISSNFVITITASFVTA